MRFYVPAFLWAAFALGGFTVAEINKADQKPAVQEWASQQQAEVKWGGLYRKATIINRRGEWYLIEYTPGKSREWVEHWRIRNVGDSDDPIGYAKPNPVWKAGTNPPRETAGEPPPRTGAGAAARTAEQKKAIEEFKQDPAYKEADPDLAKELELGAGGADQKMTPDPAAKAPNPRPVKFAGASGEFFETMKNLVIARGGKFAAVI